VRVLTKICILKIWKTKDEKSVPHFFVKGPKSS